MLNETVEFLKGDLLLRQLPLEGLVPVQTQLGVVRIIGADLEKERPEVVVQTIEIKVIDHRRGLHDPGIDRAGLRVAALLGAEYRRLLLGLANDQHALPPLRRHPIRQHNVLLPLPLRNVISGTPRRFTNRSTSAMQTSLIGCINADDANVCPR